MKKCISLIILVVLAACSKEDGNPGGFVVDGVVYSGGQTAADVTVSIDEAFNFTTKTDADGYFRIVGVGVGEHEMKINKTFSEDPADQSSSFSERTLTLEVTGDLTLDQVPLPKQTILHEGQDVSSSSATIGWSPTDDPEFREYKLYRHNSSGLDETTGTLIHVSTSRDDTLFVDDALEPLKTYFYRLYVMDDFGRFGGSNIVDLSTENVQLFLNGGFEILTNGEPDHWTLVENSMNEPENSMSIDKEKKFEGNQSLRVHHASAVGCWEQWITQYLDHDYLSPGAKYLITFNHLADFSGGDVSLIIRNQVMDVWVRSPINFTDDGNWHQFSFEFSLPDDIGNNDPSLSIHFCNDGINTYWLDNVSLARVD